jgi:hypothetical protein
MSQMAIFTQHLYIKCTICSIITLSYAVRMLYIWSK